MQDDLNKELHALRNNNLVNCGESEGANKKKLQSINHDFDQDVSQIDSTLPKVFPKSLPKQPGFNNMQTTTARMLDKKQIQSTTNSGIHANALKNYTGASTKATNATSAFPFKKA